MRDKNTPKIYPEYIHDIQDIQDRCKIPSGPARPKPCPSPGPRGPGPARARPQAWTRLGPGRAGGRLVFCIYPLGVLYLSWISWMDVGYILTTFGYTFYLLLKYVWYTLNICLVHSGGDARDPQKARVFLLTVPHCMML